MRLKGLTLKNFKGVDEHGCHIEFAPITLLFGANSAGKSTIIQALILAHQVFCAKSFDVSNLDMADFGINIGAFIDYVHKHEYGRDISIKLDFQLTTSEFFNLVDDQGRIKSIFDDPKNKFFKSEYLQSLLFDLETISIEFSLSHGNGMIIFMKDYKIWYNGNLLSHINFPKTSGEKFVNINPVFDRTFIYIGKEGDLGYKLDPVLDILNDIMFKLSKSDDEIDIYFSAKPGYVELPFDQLFSTIGIKFFENRVGTDRLKINGADIDDVDIRSLYHAEYNRIYGWLIGMAGSVAYACLKDFIHIGPLRVVPKPDANFADSAMSWHDGLAAWRTIFELPQPKINLINHILGSPDYLNTEYSIVKKIMAEIDLEQPALNLIGRLLHKCTHNELPKLSEAEIKEIFDFLNTPGTKKIFIHNGALDVDLLPYQLGLGISQMIPVIVAGIVSRNGSVVAIQQPELHIHPAWQTALADVFISAISRKDNPPIFLVETHSEHLMLRLLRRIRQTWECELPEGRPPFTPEMLSVYYIQKDENSRTQIVRLPVNNEGNFTVKWPNGFFEERIKEFM